MHGNIYLDLEFVNRLGFRWMTLGKVTFKTSHSCENPKKAKKRFYIVRETNNCLAKCFNCGYSVHFVKYLEDEHPELYQQYMARLKAESQHDVDNVNVSGDREVEVEPWEFPRKHAIAIGGTHYQGRPCENFVAAVMTSVAEQVFDDEGNLVDTIMTSTGDADQMRCGSTRRRTDSGACAKCDNRRAHERRWTIEIPEQPCPRCQFTRYYKRGGKCVYCSDQRRMELGIQATTDKHCLRCGAPIRRSGYCHDCGLAFQSNKARVEQMIDREQQHEAMVKLLLDKRQTMVGSLTDVDNINKQPEPPKEANTDVNIVHVSQSQQPQEELVVVRPAKYRGTGDKAAVYSRTGNTTILIPWSFIDLYGTDPDGNPIVPKSYYDNPIVVSSYQEAT